MLPSSYVLEIICNGEVLDPTTVERAGTVTLGRGDESDVVIKDPHLSRRHLSLTLRENGELWACDLGSKNPTELNSRPFRETQVAVGDTLTAGKCRIVVREGHSANPVSTTVGIVPTDSQPQLRHKLDAADSKAFLSGQTASTTARPALESMYRFAENIVGVNSRDSLLDQLEQALRSNLSFDRYFIAQGDPHDGSFETLRASSGPDDETQITMSQTILDEVQQQQQAVVIEDLCTTDASMSESIRELGISSYMCSPMLASGTFLGIIYVDRLTASEAFSSEDLQYLQGIAHLAGVALSQLDLQEKVEADNNRLRNVLARSRKFVAQSIPMIEVLHQVERYARHDSPVLILGDTGTGKEHLARLLHDRSSRCDQPFVAFNCALSSPTMVESELFGHVKGAFTGADSPRKGRFQLAHGGTLFLDEIGEMPLETQAKLLRVLQEQRVWPVGSEDAIEIDIRLISATHKKLKKLRGQGSFREDLYYRIAALTVDVPALSKRGNDIVLIAESLLPESLTLSREVQAALRAYPWPGNVRELENVIVQAQCNCSGDQIRLADLPDEIAREGRRPKMTIKVQSLKDMEAKHISAALRAAAGNKRRAAEILGISRNTLYQKIQAYGIS